MIVPNLNYHIPPPSHHHWTNWWQVKGRKSKSFCFCFLFFNSYSISITSRKMYLLEINTVSFCQAISCKLKYLPSPSYLRWPNGRNRPNNKTFLSGMGTSFTLNLLLFYWLYWMNKCVEKIHWKYIIGYFWQI